MMLALFTLAAGFAPAAAVDDCVSRTGGDIVICGARRGQSPYHLPRLPERYDPAQIRAEADLIPGCTRGRMSIPSTCTMAIAATA